MNISGSECSSGCESGWTVYLDQSSVSTYQCHQDYETHGIKFVGNDEDLSMVSDASSGPPHFQEDEDCYFDENGCSYSAPSASALLKKSDKEKRTAKNKAKEKQSLLDDTASSPVLTFSKKKSVESKKQSSTGVVEKQYKGKSTFQKKFGFFQSSGSEKPGSGEPGGLQGRKWE